MSIGRKAIEVKVRIGKIVKAYLYFHDEGVKTHRQAAHKAKKHGKVISVEKVDTYALLGRIEKLNLDEGLERQYLGGGVYEDELDLDGVLGLSGSTNSTSRKRFGGKYIYPIPKKQTKRRSNDGRTYKDTKEN